MMDTDEPHYNEFAIEEFLVRSEPYYRPVGDELELFTGESKKNATTGIGAFRNVCTAPCTHSIPTLSSII